VVTKLDRLAMSLPDARDIADELTAKAGVLSLGGSTYDQTDPAGRLLFNVVGGASHLSDPNASSETMSGGLERHRRVHRPHSGIGGNSLIDRIHNVHGQYT